MGAMRAGRALRRLADVSVPGANGVRLMWRTTTWGSQEWQDRWLEAFFSRLVSTLCAFFSWCLVASI